MLLEPYLEGPHCRRLRPSDPAWPAMAAALMEALGPAVGGPHQLHHVGSTSVPGLEAKPMIDLLLLVERDRWPVALAGLERAGLGPKATRSDLPDKPVRACSFRWEGERVNANLHLSAPGARAGRELLWFRDRLRAEPRLAEAYASVKRGAFRDGLVEPALYNDRKLPFLRRILSELPEEGG